MFEIICSLLLGGETLDLLRKLSIENIQQGKAFEIRKYLPLTSLFDQFCSACRWVTLTHRGRVQTDESIRVLDRLTS